MWWNLQKWRQIERILLVFIYAYDGITFNLFNSGLPQRCLVYAFLTDLCTQTRFKVIINLSIWCISKYLFKPLTEVVLLWELIRDKICTKNRHFPSELFIKLFLTRPESFIRDLDLWKSVCVYGSAFQSW